MSGQLCLWEHVYGNTEQEEKKEEGEKFIKNDSKYKRDKNMKRTKKYREREETNTKVQKKVTLC